MVLGLTPRNRQTVLSDVSTGPVLSRDLQVLQGCAGRVGRPAGPAHPPRRDTRRRSRRRTPTSSMRPTSRPRRAVGRRTSTSTRRSRLRCMRSAEPIHDLGLAAVLEPEHPAVLEEPPEHRPHRDRLRQPGHPGAQRADAADQQLDRHPGPGGGVQRVDDGLVDERVGLDPDPRGLPGRVVRRSRARSARAARRGWSAGATSRCS